MAERTEVERRMKFPVGCWELWAAITRPEELSRWFGAEVISVEARAGGRIVVRDAEGRLHRAVVETVDVPRRFAFRWLPALVGPEADRDDFLPGSLVELTIEETGEGSMLRVVETAPGAANEAVPVGLTGPLWAYGPSGRIADPIGAPPRIEARLMAGAGAWA